MGQLASKWTVDLPAMLEHALRSQSIAGGHPQVQTEGQLTELTTEGPLLDLFGTLAAAVANQLVQQLCHCELPLAGYPVYLSTHRLPSGLL